MKPFDLALLLIGAAFGIFVFYVFSSLLKLRKPARQAGPVSFSLPEAEDVLKKAGFNIIKRQVRGSMLINIDGREHLGVSQADFLAQRDRRCFLVLAKGGNFSVDPTNPSLRRELLESYYVFRPEGLLLLDMNDKSIHEIGFKFLSQKNLFEKVIQGLIVIFIITVVIGIIWLMVYLKLF